MMLQLQDIVAYQATKKGQKGQVPSPMQADPEYLATDEDTSTQMLAAMARSPTKRILRLSAKMGISQNSVIRILRANSGPLFKLQMLQHLTQDDSDRMVEF
ncbi:hypothetical protein AVEN_245918-1 [Araneus ventricosus]|uniref:Uncharacterized protein n=1 Tax=Araneus ventricosus TaxID=182803 RepID=A0A4Y2NCG8_ARAVE|nr:hypothetical protein AVEN_245918-1 [Araneus ventricosus]